MNNKLFWGVLAAGVIALGLGSMHLSNKQHALARLDVPKLKAVRGQDGTVRLYEWPHGEFGVINVYEDGEFVRQYPASPVSGVLRPESDDPG